MERIEGTLGRIESKLDGKVSHEDMQPVIRRVELLEAGETPLGRVMLRQWESLTGTVNDITLHGSRGAQEAVRRLDNLEGKVQVLESADVTRRASDRQIGNISEKHYKRLTAALSTAVAMLMLGQLFLAIFH